MPFPAGSYVAIGALFANLMEANFTVFTDDHFEVAPGLANLIGGAVFPIGLIAIFLTGANLYTGNCMYLIPAVLNGSVSRARALGWLGFSWLCNFAGAAFVAYFLAYQGEWTSKDPVKAFVIANATKKIDLKWGVAFLRGIGANWLVCLAWWQAISSKDTASKILSIWWPVFAFTAIGFEHSIANMFYVDIGLLEGANRSFGNFLLHNLIPVTLGNFVGGGVFLGLAQWATYDKGPASRDGRGHYALLQVSSDAAASGIDVASRDVNSVNADVGNK